MRYLAVLGGTLLLVFALDLQFVQTIAFIAGMLLFTKNVEAI